MPRTYPSDRAESRHKYKLKSKYGLTVEEYDEMSARQGGVCAVCGEPCTTGRRLAVDHDHATGHVRGLLCLHCNRAIGLIRDDPERAEALAAYLRG